VTLGINLFTSGFTTSYPKLIPQQLVKHSLAGERFKEAGDMRVD
jgi:hypothetical protein